MNRCTRGRMNRRTDERFGRADERCAGRLAGRTSRQTKGSLHGCTDEQTDGRTDGRAHACDAQPCKTSHKNVPSRRVSTNDEGSALWEKQSVVNERCREGEMKFYDLQTAASCAFLHSAPAPDYTACQLFHLQTNR